MLRRNEISSAGILAIAGLSQRSFGAQLAQLDWNKRGLAGAGKI
jgi:hypothetical protein